MRAFLFSLVLLTFLSPQVTQARTPESEQRLNEFYQKIWSPYCKGNSLLECPSGQAEQLRDELSRRYDAGADIDELRVFLKGIYGDQVRMEPEDNFRGLLAYIIPWLVFLLVATGLYFYWQKRIRPRKNQASNPAQTNPTENSQNHELSKSQQEIEEELRERLS